MIELTPILLAAFAAGFLGSAHCFGMCSGLSGLFAAGAIAALRTQLPLAIVYNLGRITSYVLMGLAVGVLGKATVSILPELAAPVRLVSGILIVLVGLQVAFSLQLLAPIEQLGSKLWDRIMPAARGLVPATTFGKAAGLGLLWGWLPCGLVYSALLIAATTAQPTDAALVMLAFGLGTLPAMLATGLSASKLSAIVNRNKIGAGLLIVLIGLATLFLPLETMLSDDEHAHHSMHSLAL